MTPLSSKFIHRFGARNTIIGAALFGGAAYTAMWAIGYHPFGATFDDHLIFNLVWMAFALTVCGLPNRVIAVALKQGVFEKKYANHPLVTCIEPSRPLGGFMDFDREILDRNLRLGYTDTMKTMGRYFGRVYAFRPGGREVLREYMRDYFLWLLRWELTPPASRVESVLDRVRGETPVTDRILSGRTDDPLTLACMTLDYLMEALGYPHEEAYDVQTLLPELHAALMADELPNVLQEARALSYTLEKNALSAVLAKAAPKRDSNEFLIATVMLYLRRKFAPEAGAAPETEAAPEPAPA
jgi:hypothetical protein